MSATIITMADFKASAEQAQQAARYVRRPVSVLVHWSESGAWQDEQIVPFAEFEQQAAAVALGHAGRGYLKTKITVSFDDGETYGARLDLAAHDDLGFADHCRGMLRFYETDKGRDYYQQINGEDLIAFISGIDFGTNEEAAAALRELAEITEAAAILRNEQEAIATAKAEKQAKVEAYAAELARLQAGAAEFAHLVPLGEKERGGVAAAKNVRRDLKQAFPGVKFSVKSSYDTINVRWQDGPTRAPVDEVIGKYEQGSFDGMTDCYEYSTTPFNEIYGAVRYTFSDREHGAELIAAATRLIEQQSGETVTGDTNQRIWQEWAQTLVWREASQITLVDGGWHHEGEPIEWDNAEQAADEPAAPVALVAETLPQSAPELATPAPVKPKFTAQQVSGAWSVTIEQGEERHQFDGIEAATLAEACRLSWAMLTQPTPPDDDPSGQPLPVEPAAEQAAPVEQGATAPTLTRAELLGDYAERVEAKRARLNGRAVKAIRASDASYERSRAITSAWYPGQPILVGHHSERRHRRDLARSDASMRQSVEQSRKAERLQSRAEAVGHAGIASDDPEALQQLRAKLAEREQIQESFKAANKAQRGTVAAYRLSNNGAEIRRLRQRIEQIEQLHQAAPIEQAGHGWQMGEDDGRIVLAFDQRQPAEVVTVVKAAGFVYARSRTAWVRKVTANAVRAAERLAARLADLLPA